MIMPTERPMRATTKAAMGPNRCVLQLFGADIVRTFETPEEAERFCRWWEQRFDVAWTEIRKTYAETMIVFTDELQKQGVDPEVVLRAMDGVARRVNDGR